MLIFIFSFCCAFFSCHFKGELAPTGKLCGIFISHTCAFDENTVLNSSEANAYILKHKHKLWYERKSRMKPGKEPHAAREPRVGHPCTRRFLLSIFFATEFTQGDPATSKYHCQLVEEHTFFPCNRWLHHIIYARQISNNECHLWFIFRFALNPPQILRTRHQKWKIAPLLLAEALINPVLIFAELKVTS